MRSFVSVLLLGVMGCFSLSAARPSQKTSSSPAVAKRGGSWKTEYANVKGIIEVGSAIITNIDILNRCRLLAYLHNVPFADDVIEELRAHVILQLIDEARYDQIAAQFKITVEDSGVQESFNGQAKGLGKEPAVLKKELGAVCAYDSFMQLLRSQYIASAIYFSAVPKDLLHLSQNRIDKMRQDLLAQRNEDRFEVFELAFYDEGEKKAEVLAKAAYDAIKTASKKEPAVSVVQKEAEKGGNAGYRGWLRSSQLDNATKKALGSANVHDVVLVKIRPGEWRIFYVHDKQKAGFESVGQSPLTLGIIKIPVRRDMTEEEQKQIDRRLKTIFGCSTWKEGQAVAKDFGYEAAETTTVFKRVLPALVTAPLNKWLPPIFSGDSLEVSMVTHRGTPPRLTLSEEEIKEEHLQAQLKDQARQAKAQKIFREFSDKIRIRYLTDDPKYQAGNPNKAR